MHDLKYISKDKALLVAISGGADSVAMLHYLVSHGFYCIAAHCNFHLRGQDSDSDETFVRTFCEDLGVPCHVAHFDTRRYATEKGISVEMAARELRYQWFDKLLDSLNIDYVAVGHHADDAVETFMLNLVRGTGIKGLSGMKPKHGRVIRPMLKYARQDIELYCRAHKLKYVTDASNNSDAYIRNRIRHHIVPQFKTINPSFLNTMRGNMAHLNQIGMLFMNQVDTFVKRAVMELDGQTLISMHHLKELENVEPYLFEIMSPKGFSSDAIHKAARCVDNEHWGRILFSSAYRAIIDRFNIIIQSRDKIVEGEEFNIEMEQTEMFDPVHLQLSKFPVTEDFKLSRDPNIAHFNASKIYFPLTLRHWRRGDAFRPLGMNGFKKLSDFFVDNKLSRDQKERVWVLLSGEEIVWIVGYRIDDRFKVTDKTTEILEIRMPDQITQPNKNGQKTEK